MFKKYCRFQNICLVFPTNQESKNVQKILQILEYMSCVPNESGDQECLKNIVDFRIYALCSRRIRRPRMFKKYCRFQKDVLCSQRIRRPRLFKKYCIFQKYMNIIAPEIFPHSFKLNIKNKIKYMKRFSTSGETTKILYKKHQFVEYY